MQNQTRKCSIIKIKTAYQYIIKDEQKQINPQNKNVSNQISRRKQIKLELVREKQTQIKSVEKEQNHNFYGLLAYLSGKKPCQVRYKFNEPKQLSSSQFRKGSLYLNNVNILTQYTPISTLSLQQKQYISQQIIECYIVKVQCLKLVLLNLQSLTQFTFYFSQFKLVRPPHLHPKQSWQIAQKYFQQTLQGHFVQIKINGTQIYRQQQNVYGEILNSINGDDLKQKIIQDGYVELSKNAYKYISQQTINNFNQLAQIAKANYAGIWGFKISKQVKKATNQAEQAKYKKWEMWMTQQSVIKAKNIQQQAKQIISELKKLTQSTLDYHKTRVVLSACQILYQKVQDKKIFKTIQQVIKLVSQIFSQIQTTIANNSSNMQFLKFYSKCVTICIFYLEKAAQFTDTKQKMQLCTEIQKILKIVFKTCFIGNQTFNQRLYGKKKQTNYDNFSFDSAYLNGGISSYSEQSDYDDYDKTKFQNKGTKKIASAHTKIRINCTYLISLIFKSYSSIVQNHWQICVRSNILTADFFNYLKKQKINSQSENMSQQQKKELALLMKKNFGDPSLLLLIIFERNIKVRTNALTCVLNMITNFQGKKMINSTQSFYIQKLLTQTKSSFIPKSYIIFSGLKNILYFLLFTLKYQKNIELIQTTFKTLCQLCNQCSLLDKLEFQDGMGLLMDNYIQPVLLFTWNLNQLEELKVVCIKFLSVLVSTQKKWDQIEHNYLLKQGDNNINQKLIQILKLRQSKKINEDKISIEIIKYFTKLAKKYFDSIFFVLSSKNSIWSYISHKSLQRADTIFSQFVCEIFKQNFDLQKQQQQCLKVQNQNLQQNRPCQQKALITILNKNILLLPFIQKFIPLYAALVTNDNYVHLIDILTNIQYKEWTQTKDQTKVQIRKSRQFLFHLFDTLANTKLQQKQDKAFPDIKVLLDNAFVRISFIKMIGYMSFCQEFQKKQILSPAIKVLLNYAKKYKSPNSIIKVSWAISNWIKADIFISSVLKQQLQQCINYLIQYSSSDKQKIASNCTRGIGFFLNQLKQKTLKLNNLQANKVNKQVKELKENFSQLQQKCLSLIISNLDHTIIKVRTNSTKTLRTMKVDLISPKTLQILTPYLQNNLLKTNYHLQTETLLLIKDLNQPIQARRLLKVYLTLLKTLMNQTDLQYQFKQIKTIKQLRSILLDQTLDIIHQWTLQHSKDIFITVYAYLVDCYEEQRNTNQNKILEKGQQRGQQVQKLIFNIKNKLIYDEENVITTQTTLKGFDFIAKKSDLKLICKIKQCAQNRRKYNLCTQWAQLQGINIVGDSILIGNFCI